MRFRILSEMDILAAFGGPHLNKQIVVWSFKVEAEWLGIVHISE